MKQPFFQSYHVFYSDENEASRLQGGASLITLLRKWIASPSLHHFRSHSSPSTGRGILQVFNKKYTYIVVKEFYSW
jgi:hypothetical protein